jgi:hypothetical protein
MSRSRLEPDTFRVKTQVLSSAVSAEKKWILQPTEGHYSEVGRRGKRNSCREMKRD